MGPESGTLLIMRPPVVASISCKDRMSKIGLGLQDPNHLALNLMRETFPSRGRKMLVSLVTRPALREHLTYLQYTGLEIPRVECGYSRARHLIQPLTVGTWLCYSFPESCSLVDDTQHITTH